MKRLEKLFTDHYKKMFIVPVLLLVFSLVFLGIQYAQTGSLINKDISLKGGTSATISVPTVINMEALTEALQQQFPASDISVRELADITTGTRVGVIIEATDITNKELEPFLEKQLQLTLTEDNYSVEEVGSSLGSSFFKELILAVIFSFILMSIVVFITFRKIVPSLMVIFTAFTDIVATLAIVNIFGMRISAAGVAAFLLLIGYSIDTDILLITKTLKRKEGTVLERMFGSMKTGLTMTMTTFVAVTVGLIISNSAVLRQIFTVILVGLIVDVIATYLGNAPVLLWYTKKKNMT